MHAKQNHLPELDLINDPGLPPKETQRVLGCGPTLYWKLLKTGALDAYYVGNSPRVTLSAIKKYRESHAKKPKKAA